MLKRLYFGLYDTGETILSALVFSTFFPLYITKFLEVKTYSLLLSLTYLLSFSLALSFGKLSDERGKRKEMFVLFTFATSLFCLLLSFLHKSPYLSLLSFLLLIVSHQQSYLFYNTLLLPLEGRGIASGLGVSLGYVGSSLSLLFLTKLLKPPLAYSLIALLFFLFSLPSLLTLEGFEGRTKIEILKIVKDKNFLTLLFCILSLTEVANTLIAMMGVYLRKVYGFEDALIYKTIGLSALGGVMGGIFWGLLKERVKNNLKIFEMGFYLWLTFLTLLPLSPSSFILPLGFLAGFSLSHLWTMGRILIVEGFKEEEVSTRLSFLSLSERLASTLGLFLWSSFLHFTNSYRLSVFLMGLLPLVGLLVFKRALK